MEGFLFSVLPGVDAVVRDYVKIQPAFCIVFFCCSVWMMSNNHIGWVMFFIAAAVCKVYWQSRITLVPSHLHQCIAIPFMSICNATLRDTPNAFIFLHPFCSKRDVIVSSFCYIFLLKFYCTCCVHAAEAAFTGVELIYRFISCIINGTTYKVSDSAVCRRQKHC